MPTVQTLQVFYVTLPLIAVILLAMWNNNKRIDDLKTSVNKRIDDLTITFNKRVDDLTTSVNTGFADVKVSIGKLDTGVSDFEKGTRPLANACCQVSGRQGSETAGTRNAIPQGDEFGWCGVVVRNCEARPGFRLLR
jgi:hypothetical protein